MTWGELQAQIDAAGITADDPVLCLAIEDPRPTDTLAITRHEDGSFTVELEAGAGDAAPLPLPPVESRSGVGQVVSTSVRPPLVLADDALAEEACALCVAQVAQADEDFHALLGRLRELADPFAPYCVCGTHALCHTAQHPHGCATNDCPGWREREERTHG